jgi:hypothetical protein
MEKFQAGQLRLHKIPRKIKINSLITLSDPTRLGENT